MREYAADTTNGGAEISNERTKLAEKLKITN